MQNVEYYPNEKSRRRYKDETDRNVKEIGDIRRKAKKEWLFTTIAHVICHVCFTFILGPGPESQQKVPSKRSRTNKVTFSAFWPREGTFASIPHDSEERPPTFHGRVHS